MQFDNYRIVEYGKLSEIFRGTELLCFHLRICSLGILHVVSIYVVSFIMLREFNSLYLVFLILFSGNNKNPCNSFNSLLIRLRS